MKEIVIDSKRQAELLGVLFAEYEILTTEQMSLVKQQMEKPSYFYNGDVNSLWSFYNHVTLALKKSHPRNWMEDQRKLHWFLNMEFDLENFQTVEDTEDQVVDQLLLNYGQPDNQTNILHQLADMEADQIDEDIKYAVSEDIIIHIESDQEYLERVAEIESEFKEILPQDMDAEIIWKSPDVIGDFTLLQVDNVVYSDPVGNTFEAPIVNQINLEPTSEEYLLIEAEVAQEIIEEEALFDVSKMEVSASKGFDWDISLDIEDEEEKNSGDYFL
jgi:hypothetical protein